MRKVIASFSCYKGEDLDMPFKSLFIAKFFVESGTFSSLWLIEMAERMERNNTGFSLARISLEKHYVACIHR